MLSVEDYGVIRRAHRDGMRIRAIARQFHHSRRKVRDALANPEPQPYTRTKDADAPKLGPFKATIDQILAADELAPPKQRHTARQVFRRLRLEHQYAGGYDQVRRYIAGHRQRHEVTFIPLSHDPGQRLELDFGHIYADFPEGRRQVPVLIPTWSFSNFAFALSLPTERIEAILAGMVMAFEFFGCVAREGWWASLAKSASRIAAAPVRTPVPPDFVPDWQRPLQGTVIFLRRTDPEGRGECLGHRWRVDGNWPHRLVRIEVDLTAGQVSLHTLRRREPASQPLAKRLKYEAPQQRFIDI